MGLKVLPAFAQLLLHVTSKTKRYTKFYTNCNLNWLGLIRAIYTNYTSFHSLTCHFENITESKAEQNSQSAFL